MNAVMTILMAFLVIIGVLLLNLTSSQNITSAKEKADFARNQLHAKETLQVLSKITVDSNIGKVSLPEALDKYFWLESQDSLNSSQRDLRTQLGSKIIIATEDLVDDKIYIEAEYYWRETLQDNFMLYSNPRTTKLNFDYSGSVILPSSYSRMADYYINISVYHINNVKLKTSTAVVYG